MRKIIHKKEIVVSSVATIFLILLYALIFSFSEQDGETSGGLSRLISEKCVELLYFLSGKNWTELMMNSLAEYFENPIRKLAHFCEYALLAVFILLAFRIEGIPFGVPMTLVFVFLAAGADEIHQLFATEMLEMLISHGYRLLIILIGLSLSHGELGDAQAGAAVGNQLEDFIGGGALGSHGQAGGIAALHGPFDLRGLG